MSNVLTDQAGVKREVQENNGQYAIFDENGKLLEKVHTPMAATLAT